MILPDEGKLQTRNGKMRTCFQFVCLALALCVDGRVGSDDYHSDETTVLGHAFQIKPLQVLSLEWVQNRELEGSELANFYLRMHPGACTKEILKEDLEAAEIALEHEKAAINVQRFKPCDVLRVAVGEGFRVDFVADRGLFRNSFKISLNETEKEGGCVLMFKKQTQEGFTNTLLRPDGETVLPLADGDLELGMKDKDVWILVLSATMITSFCSLIGLSLVPYLVSMYQGPSSWFSFVAGNILNAKAKDFQITIRRILSFGTGTLLAAVFLHIFPESFGLLSDAPSYFGPLMFLSGVVVALLIESFISITYGTDAREVMDSVFLSVETNMSDGKEIRNSLEGKVSAMAYNVILGDVLHNLSDGILIGSAFLGCNQALGWTTTAAIVAHEVPQEFADFVILLQSGLSIRSALCFNLLSSFSSLLGALLVLVAGEMSQTSQGALTAFGSGVLTFLTMSEMMPMIMRGKKWQEQVVRISLFLIGCAVIGGLQFFHPHCESDSNHHHN